MSFLTSMGVRRRPHGYPARLGAHTERDLRAKHSIPCSTTAATLYGKSLAPQTSSCRADDHISVTLIHGTNLHIHKTCSSQGLTQDSVRAR